MNQGKQEQFGHYIDGDWVHSPETRANINPSQPSDVIGQFSSGNADTAALAIAAAHKARVSWGETSPQVRFDLLDRAASLIAARVDALGDLLAREEGKSLVEAKGEVMRAAQIFKFFAGEALRLDGQSLASVRPGVEIETRRTSLGVVAMITPWNFPLAIPAWKVAPALAYGNTVVLKPADLVPGSAHALARILDEAGCPNGVFNLVMGPGRTVGDAMVRDERVRAISFTGSESTGRGIARLAADGLKRVQLEMGGKNPLVVLDDADFDVAVACALNGAFYSTGQRCTASSRLIVERGIHDAFVARLSDALKAQVIGDAREPETTIGPVVDARQLEQNLRYIRIGVEEGARLLCGGEKLDLPSGGYFMRPALFTETTPEMRINRDEIFGPVATVLKADDLDHAIQLANDTDYGLSAGICTTNLRAASRFKREAQAGMVMVNLPTAGVDYHVPFGGTKASSFGPREQGSVAREFYTQIKTCYTQP